MTGPVHLVHGLARGLSRRQPPLFQPMSTVFDDHDRIVHHDPDRQHKAK